MKNSKYFIDANEEANEQFLGMDAYDDDDYEYANDWESADDWGGADGWEGFDDIGSSLPATGPNPAARGGQAQPYIIQIRNTTTADIENVVILDSAAKQFESAPAYGNTTGIVVTYGLSNITYIQFLASISAGKVFETGQLRLVASASSSSVAESQVLTTTTIETKDVNGNAITRPFIPQKDSYQQINNQTDIYHKFMVDALTKITFDTISTGVTLKVYLYPSAKVNQFKQVAGKRAAVRYGNPKTNAVLAKRR